jgi:hypothetical protein
MIRERDMNMNEEGRFQKRVGWLLLLLPLLPINNSKLRSFPSKD